MHRAALLGFPPAPWGPWERSRVNIPRPRVPAPRPRVPLKPHIYHCC